MILLYVILKIKMGIDTYADISLLNNEKKKEILNKFSSIDICRGYVYGTENSYRGNKYNPFLEELIGSKINPANSVNINGVKNIYTKLCIFVGETLPDYDRFLDIKNKIMCNEKSDLIDKSNLQFKTLTQTYNGIKTKKSDDFNVMMKMAEDLTYMRQSVIKLYNPNIEYRDFSTQEESQAGIIINSLNRVCGGFYEWGKLYTGDISILEIVELMEFYKICVENNFSLFSTY